MSGIDAAEVIVDLLQRGHAVEFRVHGDSMHPVIRAEDLLHVESASSIRVGQVVLTLSARGLTAHRVVKIGEDAIVTRGDNTPSADAPVTREQVLGVVTWIERDGRRLPVRGEWRPLRILRQFVRRFRRRNA